MKALDQNKFLTDQELDSLLNLCNRHSGQRDSIIIRFTLFTGARGCEALAVRKRDLAGYARGMADDDRLFPIAVRTFRHIWNLYRPNHKKGAHCLRHTYGVRLYQNCENVFTVKSALGHVNIQNTMVYLDFVESQRKLKQAAKGMWKKAA